MTSSGSDGVVYVDMQAVGVAFVPRSVLKESRRPMPTEREARAYQYGASDGLDAANADAPTPETDASDVLSRAWEASLEQAEMATTSEREEYFVGWTHGYVSRAEGIEDEAA